VLSELEAELIGSLAEALYLERAQVIRDRSFVELGLDSIVGVEWVRALNKRYGLSLPTVKLFDHPTIAQLTEYLAALLEGSQSRVSAVAPQEANSQHHTDVAIDSRPIDSRNPAPDFDAEPPSAVVVPSTDKPRGIVLCQLSAQPAAVASSTVAAVPPPTSAQPASCIAAEPAPAAIESRSPVLSELEAELIGSLAEALYLDRAQVIRDRSFVELGLDSIVGVEWMRALNKRYGLSLPTAKLFDYPTVAQLTEYLATLLAGSQPRVSAAPPQEANSQHCEDVPVDSRAAAPDFDAEQYATPTVTAAVQMLERFRQGEVSVEELELMIDEGVLL
jgi:polyketide synthase PksN